MIVVVVQNRTARAQLVIVPGAVHYTLMRSAVNGSSLHCGMQVGLSLPPSAGWHLTNAVVDVRLQMTLDFVRNPDRETVRRFPSLTDHPPEPRVLYVGRTRAACSA